MTGAPGGDEMPATAMTVPQRLDDHERRLVTVERHVERAEPILWADETGLVDQVRDLQNWRSELRGVYRLVQLIGVGVLLTVIAVGLDIIGQAAGVLR